MLRDCFENQEPRESKQVEVQLPKCGVLEIATIASGVGAVLSVIISLIGLLTGSSSGSMTQTSNYSNQFQARDVYGDVHMESSAPEIDAANFSGDRMVAYTADLIRDGDPSYVMPLVEDWCAACQGSPLHKAAVYYNAGLAEYTVGHPDVAKTYFQDAIATAAFSDAYYALGVVCYDLEDYPAAIKNFTRSNELCEQGDCYYALAQAYEKNNQPDKAKQARQLAQEKKTKSTV